MTNVLRYCWVVLLLGCAPALWAQDELLLPDTTRRDSTRKFDPRITPFRALQQEMAGLVAEQLPQLDALDRQLSKCETDLKAITELFQYPKNLAPYRDSAMKVLVRVRRFHGQASAKIQAMHFAWQPRSRDLMSVYTRYGELSALNKTDPSLRDFLLQYRQLYGLMDILLRRLDELYNESEFLLNSKLE